MSVGWLRLEACWLDEDGEHVWIRHRCVAGSETTMLPNPPWREVNGQLQPSVVCAACGLHAILAEVSNA